MRSLHYILIRYSRGIWHGMKDPEFKGLTILLIILILIGTLVFSYLEHWLLLDAFYFTVSILVTVGDGSLRPQTDIGKIFAAFFMLIGVGTILTYIALIAQHTKIHGHKKIFKQKEEKSNANQ